MKIVLSYVKYQFESIYSSRSMVTVVVLALAAETVDKDSNGNATDDSKKDADDQAKAAARCVAIALSLGSTAHGKEIVAACWACISETILVNQAPIVIGF